MANNDEYHGRYTGQIWDQTVDDVGVLKTEVQGIDSRVHVLEEETRFTPTDAQLTAMNSGINSAKVQQIDLISGKQDALTTAQMNAVNSGVTSETVASIAGKQDALTTEQMAAVNSGATSEAIASIGSKQDALTTEQMSAVNSGITSETITSTNGTLSDVIDSGRKNLFKMTQTNLIQTRRGLTATYDPISGVVDINGVHDGTGGAIFDLYSGNAADQPSLPAGEYSLSGCPTGGSTSTYRVSLSPSINAVDIGNGADFELSAPAPLAPRILISLPSGSSLSFNHEKFKIMIAKKETKAISKAYAPYCPSLYDMYRRQKSALEGKKISFFGDSITTFTGWVPSGNKAYYTGSNMGVSNVYQTWWMRTVTALGATLCVDQGWSGRCVSNVRDAETDLVNSGAWRQTEVDKLADNGVNPDIIIIKLGINDFNKNVQLGNYDCTSALPDVPASGFDTFRESYATMLDRIMATYPLAKVFCCTLNQCERTAPLGFPEVNANDDSISDFNNAIRELAEAFGATVVDHNTCGMSYYNLDVYTGDWDSSTKKGLHPNSDGMALIAEKTVATILANTASEIWS